MLRFLLDRLGRQVQKGMPLERFYPLYEAIDTFFYSPGMRTGSAPHVRDTLDMKRVMITVWLAALPCAVFGMFNIGWQAAATAHQAVIAPGWRGAVMEFLSLTATTDGFLGSFTYGALYFLPIYLAVFIAGGMVEVAFALIRRHEITESFFVTSLLYALILPPTVPIPIAVAGIVFGVIFGKEVFGGTGKNFLNPALVSRAFVFFAYPSYLTGDAVWLAADAVTQATPLAMVADGGLKALDAVTMATPVGGKIVEIHPGTCWLYAFVGEIPGAIGETSTALILLSGLYLLATKIANWRLIFSTFIGMVLMSLFFNLIDDGSTPMMALPWYWHFVMGGFAFGMVFMVTDPVSAAMTNTGRWLYGLFIGAVAVLIRVLSPAFPEGMMLAILLGNMVAPLLDEAVIRLHIRKRRRRL